MTDFDLTLTRPLIFLPMLVAAVAVVAIAAYVVSPAPEALTAMAAPVAPLLAKAAGRDRSCETCGTMETIRRTDPATGLPVYTFSVRMRDGSTRGSTGSTRGRWLEGDRVMLIGGAAARALEEKQNVAL